MGNWVNGIVLRALAAFVAVVASVWLALWYFIPAPPSTIKIAAGFKGGNFERIAKDYRERLARHRIKLDILNNEGVLSGIKLLEDKKSGIGAGFTFASATNTAQMPNPWWKTRKCRRCWRKASSS